MQVTIKAKKEKGSGDKNNPRPEVTGKSQDDVTIRLRHEAFRPGLE